VTLARVSFLRLALFFACGTSNKRLGVSPGLQDHNQYNAIEMYLSGFYETAGCSQGYSSLTGFASTVHSSRCFYPHSGEPQWARCILVSDDDEWVLLSEGRPLRAKPLVAVTTTRDGNESGNVFKIRFEYLFLVMVCC